MEPENDYSHGRSALVRTLARDSGGMEEKTLFDHLLSEWLILVRDDVSVAPAASRV